jgi:hypothetical protein
MKRAALALPLLLALASCGHTESADHKQAHRNAEIVADAVCAVQKNLDEHSAAYASCVKAEVRDYMQRWEAANPGR